VARIITVIGRKNAGKTTLTVALSAELVRRGKRVMTIKHGHHPAEVDKEGTDSWRHFNEGRAERTIIAGPAIRVLFDRAADDYDPLSLARHYLDDADIVIAEGYRAAPLPKIEVFRKGTGTGPIYDPAGANAREWVALVTDEWHHPPVSGGPVILRFSDTIWLHTLASLAWERALLL
jgi:molybdopterin-guanine dinucleotide biosynthesis protein MobB